MQNVPKCFQPEKKKTLYTVTHLENVYTTSLETMNMKS